MKCGRVDLDVISAAPTTTNQRKESAVSLQSYVACGDIASLSPSEIIGLVPYLTGYRPDAEVVGIGLREGRPCALRATALPTVLDSESACEQYAAGWRQSGTDELWLIAYATEILDSFEALSRITSAFARYGITDEVRMLLVSPDGKRWCRFEEQILETDSAALPAIDFPKPVWGRLGAIAFHTACTALREAEALAPPASAKARREAAGAHRLALDLLTAAEAGGTGASEDRPRLRQVMRSTGEVAAAEAVYLGVALATDLDLCESAVQQIRLAETGHETRLGLWCRIARCTTGVPRAVAAALAALAAWRCADPFAAVAVKAAWEADALHPVVQAVKTIVDSGIPASYLDGIAALDGPASSGLAVSQPTLGGEVA